MFDSNLVLDQKRKFARQAYSELWSKTVKAWRTEDTQGMVWLTYAASYLVSTSGTRWAIDPFSLSTRVAGTLEPDFTVDLEPLEFAVLTHAHADHLDLNLISALAQSPTHWVIPDHMLEKVLANTQLPREKVISPIHGKTMKIGPVSLTPFESLHFHALGGVEETGYLVEFDGKRWLFPGDIRNYDHSRLPVFGRLDGVFAHLWLGKGRALDPVPPLVDAFCDFFGSLNTERIVVTHIDEIGRPANELWEDRHYKIIEQRFHQTHPDLQVESAKTGARIIL